MKRVAIFLLVIVGALAVTTFPGALADENSSANRLVVEAVKLLNQAKNEQDPRIQLELATEAEEKFNKVIERYPGSDVAVKLATGQSIGILSLEHVAREKAQYEHQAATAEAQQIWEGCDSQRIAGEIQGFVGAHLCSKDHIRAVWASACYPYMEIIDKMLDHRGSVFLDLDAGRFSIVESEILLDLSYVEISNELAVRNAQREAAISIHSAMLRRGGFAPDIPATLMVCERGD